VAPDLSPDNGTTSTNSTSPALSSTLSESSSLMDSNMIQQTTTTTIIGQQQIQVVRNNQQSPGRNSSSSSSSSSTTSKMPENILDTNAFDNKNESSSPSYNNNNNNNNNLLIMANEHKDFSCSIGDEINNVVRSPISNKNSNNNANNNNNNDNTIVDKISESDDTQKSQESVSSRAELKQTNLTETCNKNDVNIVNKNANISVASNIANAFINLSNFNSSTPPKTNGNNLSSTSGIQAAQAKNMNVIVTQQQLSTQHFMKTLSFTTSRGIFVPNVIATNITPQFTVHQYGLHGNTSGPAPNVTVNPNGNFNTNSNATIRPGISNHFRLLLQQQPQNINFNVINQTNNSANQSPILEASLQSIAKEATMQASKVLPTKTIYPNQIIHPQRSVTPFTAAVQQQQQKHGDEQNTETSQAEDTSALNATDQHIRVLTPSEIMKTLPSLSSHDNVSFSSISPSTTNTNAIDKQSNETDLVNSCKKSQNQDTSGSVSSIISNNSAISSPMTITTTTNTSECCNTFSSHFTITKATAMSSTSNNAQIIMVRGYKTYKNIFFFSFLLSF